MKTSALYSDKDYLRAFKDETRPDSLVPEPYRGDFRRDYARLIHCPSFRRLQGKTQLFPTLESDFFRSRLTHSLEVAQIAKSITRKINSTHEFFQSDPINEDLVEFAGLAHDLGHPPFGHTGEAILDQFMRAHGGFEGNAQTLRILTRLERKFLSNREAEPHGVLPPGKDFRVGLNLTFRTLVSILKYDRRIPLGLGQNDPSPMKGYYETDENIVEQTKQHVMPECPGNKLRTIECSIMDLADDIAYSTYDLEDAFKARFLTPLDLVSPKEDLLEKVAELVGTQLDRRVEQVEIVKILFDLLVSRRILDPASLGIENQSLKANDPYDLIKIIAPVYKSSSNTADIGYYRTELTSRLVGEFVRKVRIKVDEKCPKLSVAYFDEETLKQVEVLKQITYAALIMSSRFRLVAYRGEEIIGEIFEALSSGNFSGDLLLPDDFKAVFDCYDDDHKRMRVICDFIAGMTDRYAIEFYGRLVSEHPQTIFKPL